MGRYSGGSAYNFKAVYWPAYGIFRLSWTVDFYYADSRLRYPRIFTRDATQEGAERFCKKHNIQMM